VRLQIPTLICYFDSYVALYPHQSNDSTIQQFVNVSSMIGCSPEIPLDPL